MSSPAIPKLPGYTVYQPPSGDKMAYKRQTLSYLKGYPNEEPAISFSHVKGVPTAEELAELEANSPSKTLHGGTGKAPQWIENSGQVLRFFGHFLETVVESALENHRLRKVILYYYLEDDTIHSAEPRQDNSGIAQGPFLKRHKVFKEDGSVISPVDFTVGEAVTIYGRAIFLNDCDAFTRQWYAEKLGREQSGGLPYPLDLNIAYRSNLQSRDARKQRVADSNATFNHGMYMEARLGKMFDGDKVKQFLRHNREVLRFYCLWDNRADLYGDRRPYVLHYYLADDTVDILEINERNSGRDPFPVFLRRAPLPKGLDRGTVVTGKTSRTDFYRPTDLRIGASVPVLGRSLLLHDCDAFTRDWYAKNLGYSEEDLAALDVAEPIVPLPKPAVAPYNGYGTLEDSLQNCMALLPKPPRKDMHKLMNKDKIILRFQAKMVDSDLYKLSHSDQGRRFIISYFMMDDTIQIFEPPVRNSGIVCGKFLERQRVYKPQTEDIYTYQDLFVGCRVEVHRREFQLLEGDEYTYQYMENNKHIFIMADAEAIARILRAQIKDNAEEIRTAFIEMDADGSGYLDDDELETALSKAGLKFQRHQIISLRRKLDVDRSGTVSIEEFLAHLGIKTDA